MNEAIINEFIKAFESIPDNASYNYEDAEIFTEYFNEHPDERIKYMNKRKANIARWKLIYHDKVS